MKKSGFTLVELSIVLVIIGLLAGGILVGQTLVKAAELRNTVNTIVELQTAVATFKLKYNCFPGDCADATSLFSNPNITNGNGNGIYANENNGIDFNGEFLLQLHEASLIKNFKPTGSINGEAVIPVSLNNTILQIYQQFNNWVILNNNYLLALTSTVNSSLNGFNGLEHSLTPSQALYIDQKIDDGLPGAGRVLYTHRSDEGFRYDLADTLANNQSNNVGPAGDTLSCLTNDTGTLQYNNLASNQMLCSLAFDINRW